MSDFFEDFGAEEMGTLLAMTEEEQVYDDKLLDGNSYRECEKPEVLSLKDELLSKEELTPEFKRKNAFILWAQAKNRGLDASEYEEDFFDESKI